MGVGVMGTGTGTGAKFLPHVPVWVGDGSVTGLLMHDMATLTSHSPSLHTHRQTTTHINDNTSRVKDDHNDNYDMHQRLPPHHTTVNNVDDTAMGVGRQ